MKHKSKSIEFNWGEPEAFTLVVQHTLDGDRIAQEKTKQEQDRHEAEEKQEQFKPMTAAEHNAFPNGRYSKP